MNQAEKEKVELFKRTIAMYLERKLGIKVVFPPEDLPTEVKEDDKSEEKAEPKSDNQKARKND
ncbi:MAG TPA: hypothetical protein PKM21_15795 [Anaerolineales bacterium]|nr:hypothetical protein [Anaerolineales bacterium]